MTPGQHPNTGVSGACRHTLPGLGQHVRHIAGLWKSGAFPTSRQVSDASAPLGRGAGREQEMPRALSGERLILPAVGTFRANSPCRRQPDDLAINSLNKNPFHTVPGVLKARMLTWFATPFSSGPRFVRTLLHDLSILGSPTRHGSQFH